MIRRAEPRPRSTEWMEDAACLGEETSTFFTTDGEGYSDWRFAEAKRICDSCPVRPQCNAWGWREPYGFWAGKFHG